MHTHFYLLAILAPSVICTPLPASNSELPDAKPIADFSSDSNLEAAITYKRAQGREVETSDALAEEKRAYELKVLRDDTDFVIFKSRSAQDIGADGVDAEIQAAEVVVEQEAKMGERLL